MQQASSGGEDRGRVNVAGRRSAASRRAREAARRRARRRGQLRLAALLAAVALAVVLPLSLSSSPRAPGRPVASRLATGRAKAALGGLPFASPSGLHMRPGPNLAPGSNPAVLPGDVLIADEENNRLLVVNPAGSIVWQFPRKGALAPGQSFLTPDDAFFTPQGTGIIATEESDQVISLLGLRPARIKWRYGTPGKPGGGANQLNNPDDAMMLPDGKVLLADIKECSLLMLAPPSHVPLMRIGQELTSCYHEPPLRFGSPNGVFPLTNGNYLVTEINGDWVDEITLGGKVLWSTHPPGVYYPSDSNEVSPGVFLTVDYSTPGQIVEFNRYGKLLRRYGPTHGPGMLSHPSLCEPIPTNGYILCNDDGNDRVIVIDPHTDRIVWQYGHTGVAGSAPGYLAGPDGVDLAPPYSLLVRHAPTMGAVPSGCATGLPAGACTRSGP